VTRTKFAVLGGGAWGLAIARLLNENGHNVSVWEHNPEFARLLIETHSNPNLLKGVVLPESILFSNNLEQILTPDTQHIIFATPAQFLRQTLRQAAPVICRLQGLESAINVAKGIEEHSMMRMSEILTDELPCDLSGEIVCLSGPSHAEEVARQIPTAVVIAGRNEELLFKLQTLFSNPYFRMYRSDDLIGVEIGGAVKNIIAIAAGIIDGLGYGDNTKGALVTRGLVEIQRLGIALGAKPETFLGLSGIGDLYTTASSLHSRNRFVGYEIGKGRLLNDILASMPAVAEGVTTTRSVLALSRKQGIEMPITEQVYEVLFNNKFPKLAISELMTRSLKSE
jgi:glycerol-3-phosphate dehydrogenase (NAD(P)+)